MGSHVSAEGDVALDAELLREMTYVIKSLYFGVIFRACWVKRVVGAIEVLGTRYAAEIGYPCLFHTIGEVPFCERFDIPGVLPSLRYLIHIVPRHGEDHLVIENQPAINASFPGRMGAYIVAGTIGLDYMEQELY